jgi:hypothetical protein
MWIALHVLETGADQEVRKQCTHEEDCEPGQAESKP